MSKICVSVPRQIDMSIVGKRCTRFTSFKSCHKYESGRNSDYLFYMYKIYETWTKERVTLKRYFYIELCIKFIGARLN